MVSRLLLQILWDLFGRSLLGNGPFNSFLLLPCMVSKSSLSNNLGLVAELHLQQSSDLLGHQVQKSFVYSRDFWKTNDKRPLVIQSPYISHQYYLKYLCCRDKASATTFSMPGTCTMSVQNSEIKASWCL